jgi:O-acetyl-ADP-ribose deacetylase (regulator of RNase III)
MKTLKGDLIKLAIAGNFDLIVHGCNCFCTMGAGIAVAIRTTFPAAFRADQATKKGSRDKLGQISYATIDQPVGQLVVVNGYTQYDWQGSGRKADDDAIRSVFRTIKQQFSGFRIGYPAIGAGLAGGDWSVISQIIDAELTGEDHTFVVYHPN